MGCLWHGVDNLKGKTQGTNVGVFHFGKGKKKTQEYQRGSAPFWEVRITFQDWESKNVLQLHLLNVEKYGTTGK